MEEESSIGKQRKTAMEAALRILSRRNHAVCELRAKLYKKGFSNDAVDCAVQRCQHLNYLNDEITAKALAGQLVRRGYGPLKIRQTLAGKGFDESVIRQALDQNSDENRPDAVETARKALEKKRRQLNRELDPKKRLWKAYRFLAGRGFSSDVIQTALDGLFENMD